MQLLEHTQGTLKSNMCGLIQCPIIGSHPFYTRSHMCTSLTKCVSFDDFMMATMKNAVIWDVALRLVTMMMDTAHCCEALVHFLDCGLSHVRRERSLNWEFLDCWGTVGINYLPRRRYPIWLKFGCTELLKWPLPGCCFEQNVSVRASTFIWHSPVGRYLLRCFVKIWVYSTLTSCVLKTQISSVTKDILMSARTEIDLMCCVLPKGHTFKCNG